MIKMGKRVISKHQQSEVISKCLWHGAKTAVLFVDKDFVVRATRRGALRKGMKRMEIVFTAGTPSRSELAREKQLERDLPGCDHIGMLNVIMSVADAKIACDW